MAKFLGKDLDDVEKAYLINLAHHEGYKILQKLGADFCTQATKDVISLDPTDDKYDVKLAKLQLTARVANDLFSSLFGSVDWHLKESKQKQKEDEEALEVQSPFRG